ncbi:MAG: Fe-S cluster assembly protein SufB [Candidatus Woesearchaeota archaeon]
MIQISIINVIYVIKIKENLIKTISKKKNEPKWMLDIRLKALDLFNKTDLPKFGPNLNKLNFNKILYYKDPEIKESNSWKKIPKKVREIYEKLGIPKAEINSLGGAGAQYESEIIYHNIKKELKEKGVIFENMDNALKKYPNLVKKYFLKCVPYNDHKFMMLHAAVWSGGTFIYVPKNVKINEPLQAYFRMNSENLGQFEHTLIIAEENSEIHYIEGCSAPAYKSSSLHAGCVEIFVHKNAKVRYSSVENWSINTFNLNTKRAIVEKDGKIEWVSGNMGSGTTMLYPTSILKGENALSESLGIAFAGKNQNQDIGSKAIHLASNTKSIIKSKSISKDNGISTYRGKVFVSDNAYNCSSSTTCDALLINDNSISNTYPSIDIRNNSTENSHEASVGRISDKEMFFLKSRGLNEEEAIKLIVSGFINPVIKQLPLEYAVEMNKLIELEMENSVG